MLISRSDPSFSPKDDSRRLLIYHDSAHPLVQIFKSPPMNQFTDMSAV